MDAIISDSSLMTPNMYQSQTQSQSQSANSTPYNFNIKTSFLFVILLCGCCLLSIGYNFEINKAFDLGSVSFWACLILTMFLFYVLYEFFKSDDCNDSGKQQFADFGKFSSAMGRGKSFAGQQGTNAMSSMSNKMARYYSNPNPVPNPNPSPNPNPNPYPNSQNYPVQFDKYGQSMLNEQYRIPLHM